MHYRASNCQLPRSLLVLLFPSLQSRYIIVSNYAGTQMGKLGAMLVNYSSLRLFWELRIIYNEVFALISMKMLYIYRSG
jgi:hypothetical protein